MDIKTNSSSFDEACFCLELLREKASDLKDCFVQYQQGNCRHSLSDHESIGKDTHQKFQFRT